MISVQVRDATGMDRRLVMILAQVLDVTGMVCHRATILARVLDVTETGRLAEISAQEVLAAIGTVRLCRVSTMVDEMARLLCVEISAAPGLFATTAEMVQIGDPASILVGLGIAIGVRYSEGSNTCRVLHYKHERVCCFASMLCVLASCNFHYWCNANRSLREIA